jgi:hypothetical protein
MEYGIMINQQSWLEKTKELYNISQEIKLLEKKAAELSGTIKVMTNNESYAFGGLKYYYEVRTGSVDYGSIPELRSVDLDLYRKPPVKVLKLAIESIL